jgi:hypothetical protein
MNYCCGNLILLKHCVIKRFYFNASGELSRQFPVSDTCNSAFVSHSLVNLIAVSAIKSSSPLAAQLRGCGGTPAYSIAPVLRYRAPPVQSWVTSHIMCTFSWVRERCYCFFSREHARFFLFGGDTQKAPRRDNRWRIESRQRTFLAVAWTDARNVQRIPHPSKLNRRTHTQTAGRAANRMFFFH